MHNPVIPLQPTHPPWPPNTRPVLPLGPLGPIIPTDPRLLAPCLNLQPPPFLPCYDFPCRDPTNPAPAPPPRILSDPLPFAPLPFTRAPLRVTFSCNHTAPSSVLPTLYTQPQASSSTTPPASPPHTLPHPCRECALTLTQTALNAIYRVCDPAIAALEAQIADARPRLWVGARRVVAVEDPALRAYERAQERLRVLVGERAEALWEGRRAWETLWGAW